MERIDSVRYNQEQGILNSKGDAPIYNLQISTVHVNGRKWYVVFSSQPQHHQQYEPTPYTQAKFRAVLMDLNTELNIEVSLDRVEWMSIFSLRQPLPRWK